MRARGVGRQQGMFVGQRLDVGDSSSDGGGLEVGKDRSPSTVPSPWPWRPRRRRRTAHGRGAARCGIGQGSRCCGRSSMALSAPESPSGVVDPFGSPSTMMKPSVGRHGREIEPPARLTRPHRERAPGDYGGESTHAVRRTVEAVTRVLECYMAPKETCSHLCGWHPYGRRSTRRRPKRGLRR